MTNQEAIETIEANYPPENYSMLREALDMAIALLKEQEAEWIYGENETGVDGWHCSECNFFEPWFYDFDDDIDFIKRYTYCPKCRRRMTSYTGKLEETKIIEQKLTSVPKPSYPVVYCGCSPCFESPKYKKEVDRVTLTENEMKVGENNGRIKRT